VILMYHKVDIIAPTVWWLSRDAFRRQMAALSKMRVVHLSEYSPEDPNRCVITFDDAYENVYRHAFPILQQYNYPFELFVNGAFIGKWNNFDPSEPRTRICGMEHLLAMSEAGGRIQWHTNRHRNLTILSLLDASSEIRIPEDLRQVFQPPHLSWFAYPYGAHTPDLVRLIQRKFEGAVSVHSGSDRDRFQLNRIVATDQAVRV
jgi:peptidoglycan/xylan/chitin deacetylase (PgdA/CDA1 family)